VGDLRRDELDFGHACAGLLTFVFTHVEGIRWNGAVRYFKSWIPEAPKPLLGLIVPLEILGQFMRLISLSVRLFANMLAATS